MNSINGSGPYIAMALVIAFIVVMAIIAVVEHYTNKEKSNVVHVDFTPISSVKVVEEDPFHSPTHNILDFGRYFDGLDVITWNETLAIFNGEVEASLAFDPFFGSRTNHPSSPSFVPQDQA